jgi:long-chain acyl-CoA synthetase
VPVTGAAVAPEELQALVAEQLASYKRITHLVFVEEVPRLPSGKALRRQLKERWQQESLG